MTDPGQLIDPGQLLDPVSRARAAAVDVARAHGVLVHDPRVLADGANLVVHLRPAPLVAKVALSTHLVREPAPWLARELAVAAHLDGADVPVVRASDLLPAVVHERDGQVMTFWEHLPHDAAAVVDPGELGAMLRELHAALTTCPVPLTRLATPLEDLDRFLRTRGSDGMRRAFARVRAALPDDPGQALHGDPHPGNLLRAPTGWTWADLEDTCSGPLAWDLVCVDTSTRVDGAAALRAYGDVPDLTPWRELRRLHATAWTCLYAERLPRHRDAAAALLAAWG